MANHQHYHVAPPLIANWPGKPPTDPLRTQDISNSETNLKSDISTLQVTLDGLTSTATAMTDGLILEDKLTSQPCQVGGSTNQTTHRNTTEMVVADLMNSKNILPPEPPHPSAPASPFHSKPKPIPLSQSPCPHINNLSTPKPTANST